MVWSNLSFQYFFEQYLEEKRKLLLWRQKQLLTENKVEEQIQYTLSKHEYCFKIVSESETLLDFFFLKIKISSPESPVQSTSTYTLNDQLYD